MPLPMQKFLCNTGDIMKREFIAKMHYNTPTKIAGWVETYRDTKYMIFIVLKDATGKIQVSVDKGKQPELVQTLSGVIPHSVITVEGEAVKNELVKLGGAEFLPTHIEVNSLASALPIDEKSSVDQRLNYRWLDLREEHKNLIFNIQSALVKHMRNFLYDNGFIELHSPKLIGAASESGSDVFEVKYFDGKAYLSQSPQFYKQMAMASGFERIFEVGPVFRAENSFTSRHSTEFTGFDIEFSFIESYEDVMVMQENLLTYALEKLNGDFGKELEEIFKTPLFIPTLPFPRIKLADLYDELEARYGYCVPESEKTDLTTEAEKLSFKYAKEVYNHEFLFVTHFPKDKRAFYHMRKDGVLQGYDLLWRGVEITTGAQREHNYEKLLQQAQEKGLGKDIDFYLEFFKYGCPPHGGFGLGIDRLTMLLLNLSSLKEAEYIFRGPTRLFP
jgi:nondiscriminating aspartyl-tRNA synthetase